MYYSEYLLGELQTVLEFILDPTRGINGAFHRKMIPSLSDITMSAKLACLK